MIVYWIKAKDGSTYPIRYNMTVFYQVATDCEIPSNKLQKFLASYDDWPLSRQYSLHRYALESGARKAGTQFNMSELDFMDWISDDDTILDQIMKFFIESLTTGSEVSKTGKKPTKDKA